MDLERETPSESAIPPADLTPQIPLVMGESPRETSLEHLEMQIFENQRELVQRLVQGQMASLIKRQATIKSEIESLNSMYSTQEEALSSLRDTCVVLEKTIEKAASDCFTEFEKMQKQFEESLLDLKKSQERETSQSNQRMNSVVRDLESAKRERIDLNERLNSQKELLVEMADLTEESKSNPRIWEKWRKRVYLWWGIEKESAGQNSNPSIAVPENIPGGKLRPSGKESGKETPNT